MTDPKIVRAYGGPEAGRLIPLPAGSLRHTVYDESVTAPFVAPGQRAPAMSRFAYVLVHSSDGSSALVPERDNDLLRAFQRCSNEPGDRETELLSIEVQRRGLSF